MYEDFIKNEKEFSIRFLKSQQILPDRFDEDEYLVIKELFENVSMIEKIYEVIEYILKKEKIYNISKIIVMGDFLFSMGCLNSKDPVSLVLKISRDDYEYQIDISSIKSTENNLSNSNNNSNCLNCNFDNIQNPTIASIKLKDKIRNRGISNNKMRKIEIVKRFEIICTVDYDCRITDNSFLYIPGNRLTK